MHFAGEKYVNPSVQFELVSHSVKLNTPCKLYLNCPDGGINNYQGIMLNVPDWNVHGLYNSGNKNNLFLSKIQLRILHYTWHYLYRVNPRGV